jgi:ATP-dependent Clp protease ATP-binding subunit ClpA
LLERGYDAKNGVRPLRRLIQDEIEDHVATGLLEDSYDKGDIISIGTKKDELTFTTIHE